MNTYNSKNRPKILSLEDEIILCDTKHSIKIAKGYYLDAGGNRLNDYAFQKLGIDTRQVAKQVYGYDKGGSFPFADNLEDLLKMVNFLWDKDGLGGL